eukprot:11391741-Karenia_brevis.AAC.1
MACVGDRSKQWCGRMEVHGLRPRSFRPTSAQRKTFRGANAACTSAGQLPTTGTLAMDGPGAGAV